MLGCAASNEKQHKHKELTPCLQFADTAFAFDLQESSSKLLSRIRYIGNALADRNGYGFRPNSVFSDIKLNHAGDRIQRSHLVENEIPNAVVDAATVELFCRLQGMRVVANQTVGTGPDNAMGFHALSESWFERMFCPPMQADHDATVGVGAAQTTHRFHDFIGRKHADTGLLGQKSIVLESHLQRSNKVNAARLLGNQ